jgi:hypothetical protein
MCVMLSNQNIAVSSNFLFSSLIPVELLLLGYGCVIV